MSPAPARDELEVDIFGPGFGEAVLIHVGDGDWIAIDSCIEPGQPQSTSLAYLDELAVDVSDKLKLIVATHWHDDHVSGISQLVKRGESSRFASSAGVQTDDFLTLVGASKRSMLRESGLQEFATLLEILASRPRGPRLPTTFPHFAKAHGVLWARPEAAGIPGCTVEALSPSDQSVQLALREIAGLLPEEMEAKRRVSPKTPNHTAVVTLVRLGESDLLFGADLQERGTGVAGWSEILALPTLIPSVRAEVFKVPHHGSANADHPDVWTRMLASDPVALVSPFNRGSFLPTDQDRSRLRQRTSRGYLTAPPQSPKRVRRSHRLERELQVGRRDMRLADGPTGHVRLRRPIQGGASWSVELLGAAQAL